MRLEPEQRHDSPGSFERRAAAAPDGYDRRVSSRIAYRAELDGLRGIAILLVLGHHINPFGPRLLEGGFVGVDLFFVLSGCLITTILLREHEQQGRLGFGAFYLRRATRLLPALFVMLGGCVVYTGLTWSAAAAAQVRIDALYAVFYLSSFVNIERPLRLLTMTWSLSIEEWFYSLWPLIAAGLLRLRKTSGLRPMILGLAFAVIACTTWRFYLSEIAFASFRRIYFGLDARIDGLAMGALLAVALESGWSPSRRLATALAALGAVVLGVAAVTADWRTSTFSVFGYTVVSLASSALVLHAMRFTFRPLAFAPLVYIGRISYSLYLWMLPILTFMRDLPLVVAVAALFAVSAASYHVVEQPGLRLRKRFGRGTSE